MPEHRHATRARARAARASETQRRGGFHDAVMIWESGPDSGCTRFSDSWLSFTGRRLADELGDGWAGGVHPADLEPCLAIYRSAFAARSSFQMQYRLRRYDGEYRWILDIGTPQWDSEHQFLGYVGTCIDVTDAQRSEADPSVGDAMVLHAGRGRSPTLLTHREWDVAALLARGLTNYQVATELAISVRTVRVHVEHILGKLGLHSRAQVAAWMLGQRIIASGGAVSN